MRKVSDVAACELPHRDLGDTWSLQGGTASAETLKSGVSKTQTGKGEQRGGSCRPQGK